MRELFKPCDQDPSGIALQHLEHLCDVNYLKPVVWAEVEHNKKKHFSVSLGVRDYLRSLFLYAKLCDLRNSSEVIALQDVQAFQSVDRHSEEYRNADNDSASKYETPKDPCTSCKIFFNKFETQGETQPQRETQGETRFNYFGNCAEYDLVQRENSLSEIKTECHWEQFQSACRKHIRAFTTLKRKVSNRQLRSVMHKYFNSTRNTNLKALKYKRIGSGYELVTRDYKPK